MFELSEYLTIAGQINQIMCGKVIRRGTLGNSPHKFVWYNRTHEEFERLSHHKTIGKAHVKGRWMFIPLEPDTVLVIGECGGKILFHPAGSTGPARYHLWLTFEDDSLFTVTTQMWGAMELYQAGKELQGKYVKDMRHTPIDPAFTLDYFNSLIESLLQGEKRSVKSLLTQDQLIPGLGNAIAQDILFQAGLHPRHPLEDLSQEQRRELYHAILETLQKIIEQGGRYDETDLLGQSGRYIRLMDNKAVGKPCPRCKTTVEKIQYLGGACYFCPQCQK